MTPRKPQTPDAALNRAGVAAPTPESVPTTPGPTLTQQPSQPARSFSFLLPAQQPGELGRLGGYRILSVIDEGGMGIVFAVEEPLSQRPLAMKVMKPEASASPEARKRFVREAKAAASLTLCQQIMTLLAAQPEKV